MRKKNRGSAHRCVVTHLRSRNADRLASGSRLSHTNRNASSRGPKPVESPGLSTHSGKPLRHHSGGHRTDPEWRAGLAENYDRRVFPV